MHQVGDAYATEGIVFIPIPVEVLGGWEMGAVDQIWRLGAGLASRTGRNDSNAVSNLFQWLSVLHAKGNAALLISRIPDRIEVLDAPNCFPQITYITCIFSNNHYLSLFECIFKIFRSIQS